MQGTLYSDVIESGGGTGAATIKSHHNVGGLPDDLEFELVEPLRALFKDEVRAVGAELGLPERLVWRQPFPGPGLAIRIVGGEATKERLDMLRDADAILQDEIRKAGLYRELWQSFCVLPDVRTVGVQGDERTYGYVVVIRAVTSDDAMTADWARLPYDLLEQIASRMINELREVNRVVLDITSQAARHDRVGVTRQVRACGWTGARVVYALWMARRGLAERQLFPPDRGLQLRMVTAVVGTPLLVFAAVALAVLVLPLRFAIGLGVAAAIGMAISLVERAAADRRVARRRRPRSRRSTASSTGCASSRTCRSPRSSSSPSASRTAGSPACAGEGARLHVTRALLDLLDARGARGRDRPRARARRASRRRRDDGRRGTVRWSARGWSPGAAHVAADARRARRAGDRACRPAGDARALALPRDRRRRRRGRDDRPAPRRWRRRC